MPKNLIYCGGVGAVILIVALLAWQGLVTKNDFGVAFLTLLGTFFGALFAFRLDEHKETEKERKRRKSALDRALLVLGAQHNEIRVIKREIDRFQNVQACAFSMNASQPVDSLGLEQNIDDLDFLLESDDPNMIFKLHIEQLRFDQAIETVRMRNAFCVDKLQPAMAAHNLPDRMNETMIRKALGNLLYESAVHSAETMTYHISESDKSIPEVAKELGSLAKKLFPGEKFVVFRMVEPKPQFDPRNKTECAGRRRDAQSA